MTCLTELLKAEKTNLNLTDGLPKGLHSHCLSKAFCMLAIECFKSTVLQRADPEKRPACLSADPIPNIRDARYPFQHAQRLHQGKGDEIFKLLFFLLETSI